VGCHGFLGGRKLDFAAIIVRGKREYEGATRRISGGDIVDLVESGRKVSEIAAEIAVSE